MISKIIKSCLPVSVMPLAKRTAKTLRQIKRNFAKKYYSQLGEDIIMSTFLSSLGLKQWTWLDIGAHNPRFLSNTALWYRNGMEGINVEANPELIREFYKKRKRDINLNVAVGDSEGVMNFYVMESPTLSTLSEEEAKRYENLGEKIRTVVPIKTMTVADIVKKYCNGNFPDVLCLDAEGYDLPILKTIEWEITKPKMICVESIPFNIKFKNYFESMQKSELIQYLISKDYSVIAFTGINTIMIHNSQIEKA